MVVVVVIVLVVAAVVVEAGEVRVGGVADIYEHPMHVWNKRRQT